MHTPSRADASGILHCIGDALKQVGVTNVLDSELKVVTFLYIARAQDGFLIKEKLSSV